MGYDAERENKLQENPLLSRLVEAGVENSITFWGYIGPSDDDVISLHPRLESPRGSIEIAKSDILHVEDVPESVLLFGAKVVWVRRDAEIVRHGADTADVLGRVKEERDRVEAPVPADVEEVQSGRLRMRMMARSAEADCHSPCATCRDCSSVCVCICRYTDPPA